MGLGSCHFLEALQGLLGATLLNRAHKGVEDDDGQNGARLDPIAQNHGDEGRPNQDKDNKSLKLLENPFPERSGRRLR